MRKALLCCFSRVYPRKMSYFTSALGNGLVNQGGTASRLHTPCPAPGRSTWASPLSSLSSVRRDSRPETASSLSSDRAVTICRALQPQRARWQVLSPQPRPLAPSSLSSVPVPSLTSRASFNDSAYTDELEQSVDEELHRPISDDVEEKLIMALRQRQIKVPEGQGMQPGRSFRVVCPICDGGSSRELSLSVTPEEGLKSALWNCFRGSCGWTGRVEPDRPLKVRSRSPAASGRPGSPTGNSASTSTSAPYPTSRRDGSDGSMFRSRGGKPAAPTVPDCNPATPLSAAQRNWLHNRGISEEAIAANALFAERGGEGGEGVYCPMLGTTVEEALCFPYYRDGKIVNIKYRAMPKLFWQYRGAEKILFGYDQVFAFWAKEEAKWKEAHPNATDKYKRSVIVVEGEMDKLALNSAGIWNVVSVPDGAPSKVKEGELPPADLDKKYSYLWACKDLFDAADVIVLATDADAPGLALAEELARRLGRERCHRVAWPQKGPDRRLAAPTAEEIADIRGRIEAMESENDPDMQEGIEALRQRLANLENREVEGGPRKDANDVLLMDGPKALVDCVSAAEPYPVKGLYRFKDFWDDIESYYQQRMGTEVGMSTGWASLDQYYRVVPGELTVITGVPNSGKSEWLDALLVNLSDHHGWSFAMCSMEKRVPDHARQLLEKYTGRPFFNNTGYARNFERMSEAELHAGLEWIDDRFQVIRSDDDALPTIDWILEKARLAVYRNGVRGLVIDPYNELDHSRNRDLTETEYVSQLLSKLKRFAQHHDAHVWFVAHPRQLRDWKGGAPNLYDISGSAHFINKCDNGIVIHRNRDKDAPLEERRKVEILVRKVRNKAAGTLGEATLLYDFVTGRYEDPGLEFNAPPPPPGGWGGGGSGGRGGGGGGGTGSGHGHGGNGSSPSLNGSAAPGGATVLQTFSNGTQLYGKKETNPVTGKASSLPRDVLGDLMNDN